MIDWRQLLRAGMRGVAVEGKDDKVVIEAFLDAGEKQGYWQNWHSRLAIEAASGFPKALDELTRPQEYYDIWALLDREWRSADEIRRLQTNYPKLIFLPRLMIENYAIDPNELAALLPLTQLQKLPASTLAQTIEIALGDWLLHGSLSSVLYENGADSFCGRTTGFPNRLINPPYAPVTDETEIKSLLSAWHDQLDPSRIMPAYRQRASDFMKVSRTEQYRLCIDGKEFFNQVVVQRVLNPKLGQKSRNDWWATLFEANAFSSACPTDLIPVLKQLIETP